MSKRASGQQGSTEWRLPDTPAFLDWIPARFSSTLVSDAASSVDGLLPQQRFAREYMAFDSPYRGVVLYHGLGSGKTCSAIAIAEALRSQDPKRRICVMLPASLRNNYYQEVRFCGAHEFREGHRWKRGVQSRMQWELAQEDDGAGVAFEDLSGPERDQVRAQIDQAVQSVHHTVAYNGITASIVKTLTAPRADGRGAFDDTVVIIDEVHNFIGRVLNARLLQRVYDALMNASRIKLVLLSGTPLVNRPEELALLLNLAHGHVAVHDIVCRSQLDDAVIAKLSGHKEVHEFTETTRKDGMSVLTIRLLPDGFQRREPAGSSYSGALEHVGVGVGAGRGIKGLRDLLRAEHPALGVLPEKAQPAPRTLQLLPTDPEAFHATFVDEATGKVRNTDALERRMLGLVSYFRGHDPSLYPDVQSLVIAKSPLSARQFAEYVLHRTIEVRQETTAKRFAARVGNGKAGGGEDGSGAGYRSTSRAICNFAFPQEVPRPTRASVKAEAGVAGMLAASTNHDDDDQPGGDDTEPHARAEEGRYLAALDAAVMKLRSMPGRLALEEGQGGAGGLQELSPKFASVVGSMLKLNKGSAIVYSQFRRAEGINLLAAALESSGFRELRIQRVTGGKPGSPSTLQLRQMPGPGQESDDGAYHPRFMFYTNDDPQIARATLALFNDQLEKGVPSSVRQGAADLMPEGAKQSPTNLRGELARVLLVTSSGSEGITTRNVRQVHILEPFWHANRIQQVIGRAVRAYSHSDLPPNERNVSITVHMATFTHEQSQLFIAKKDGGKTSDEYIHEVAQRKRLILTGLMECMRAASIDCRLHSDAHARADAYIAERRGVPAPAKARCFQAPKASRKPGLNHQLLWSAFDVRFGAGAGGPTDKVAAGLVRVRDPSGRELLADHALGILYDAVAYREKGILKPVGRVKR